ncbi:hypothetical protein LX32DRAFT_147385 [Colletotrichum zoysiae]|uniref:Uncharacterized protein n=1 Tax=Colletotrichum zoysiae TaxID=1216348 RepID=A0AAD9LZ43_9PEZI|nr:hypothetical protein LX32DRAFT_147385 [Colletotrichum zoysiae]
MRWIGIIQFQHITTSLATPTPFFYSFRIRGVLSTISGRQGNQKTTSTNNKNDTDNGHDRGLSALRGGGLMKSRRKEKGGRGVIWRLKGGGGGGGGDDTRKEKGRERKRTGRSYTPSPNPSPNPSPEPFSSLRSRDPAFVYCFARDPSPPPLFLFPVARAYNYNPFYFLLLLSLSTPPPDPSSCPPSPCFGRTRVIWGGGGG